MSGIQRGTSTKSGGADKYTYHEEQPAVGVPNRVQLRINNTKTKQKMSEASENKTILEALNVTEAQVRIPNILRIQVKDESQKSGVADIAKNRLIVHEPSEYVSQSVTPEVHVYNIAPRAMGTNKIKSYNPTKSPSKEASREHAKKMQDPLKTVHMSDVPLVESEKNHLTKEEFQVRSAEHKAKDDAATMRERKSNTTSKHTQNKDSSYKKSGKGKLTTALIRVKQSAKKVSKRIKRQVRQMTHRASVKVNAAIAMAVLAVAYAFAGIPGVEGVLLLAALVAIAYIGVLAVVAYFAIVLISIPAILILDALGIPAASTLGTTFIVVSDLLIAGGYLAHNGGRVGGGGRPEPNETDWFGAGPNPPTIYDHP